MSTQVEERIVKMEFDNKTFEKNVASTMSQLDSFNKQLNFDNVQSGFQKVENAAKKVSFQKIQDGVEILTQRFSTMGIIAQTAIENLTNSAVNAGKTLVKSLSVDNIAAGWEKFADKTSSVGTLVAQGYSLDEVNEQLKLLNWYTDETSYNFVDMVANIAKFTASGQKLPESVIALMGIANWAATSGQNAATASRAMYQLSQAMGAGVMRREDYRSIQNASMDTAEFRQKALDAAVALGTLRDNLDGTYTSLINNQGAFTRNQFAEHLTEDAWFTSEVMLKVYNDYASAVTKIYDYVEETGVTASEAIEILGDEIDAFGLKAFNAGQEARTFRDVIDSVKDAVSTGWMNTYELVFGDYYEAKELWTDLANSLYDVFTAGVAARNEQLEIWKSLEGRTYLLEAFWKIWDGIGGAVTTVKDAFREMAPALTGEEMAETSKQIYILVTALTQLEGVSEKLTRIGRGFGAAWSMVNNILYQVGYGVATGLFKIFDALNIDVLELVATLADGLSQLYEWVNGGEVVISILDTITDIIAAVIRSVREFFVSIGETGPFQALSIHLENLRIGLLEFIGNLADQKDEFVSYIRTLDGISLENIQKGFEKFQEVFLGSIGTNAKSSFSAFVEGIKQGFNEITSNLGRFGSKIKEGFGKIFDWIGHLAWDRIIPAAGFLGMISLTRTLTDAMAELTAIWRPFSKAILMIAESIKNYFSAKAFNERSKGILNFAIAVGVLSVAISLLTKSAENLGQFASAVGSVIILTGALLAMVAVFNKFGGKEQLPGLLAMTTLFAALAGLVHIIDSADSWKNSILNAGLILVAIEGFMVFFQYLTSKYVKTVPKGTWFFLSLGVGVRAMVSALEALMGFNWGRGSLTIWNAVACLAALSALLVVVSGAARLGKGAPVLSLITAVIALKGLIDLVEVMAEKDYGTMQRGLRAMGPMLLELVALTTILKLAGKNIGSAGAGILATSAGILLLIPAITLLSSLPLNKIIKGGTAVAALVGVFNTITMASHFAGENASKAAATILATAGAVLILSVAATGLSLLDTKTLWNAVGAVDSMVAVLALLTASLKFIPDNENKKVSKVIGSLRSSLVVIAGAVGVLAVLDQSKIKTASIALGSLMTLFGILGAASRAIKIDNETFKSLNRLTLVTGALGLIVSLMSLFPTSQDLFPKVASVGILMLAMSAVLHIIDDTKISWTHVVALGVLGAVAAALAWVLAYISQWPEVKGLTANTIALSVLIIALSGAMKLLSELNWKGYLIAVAALASVLAIIVGVLWGIGKLYNQNAGFHEAVLGFASMLGDFVMAIGVAITQGAVTITELMVKVAENLSSFSEKIGPFVESMKGIGDNTVVLTAAKGLADVVAAMGRADFVTGVNSILGFDQTDMGSFSERMTKLGEGVSGFWEKVKGIDDPNGLLEKTVGAAQSLAALENSLPPQNGRLQTWLGSQSLDTFGRQVGLLATGLVLYATRVSAITDFKVVEKSTTAATALAELDNKLPPTGGYLQTWLGSPSLTTFSSSLENLANGIVRYTDIITEKENYDYKAAIQNSIDAADMLVALNDRLVPQGGLFDLLLGRQDLSEFGDNLTSLARSMVDYCDIIEDVDYETMGVAMEALVDLTTAAEKVPRNAWWAESLQAGLTSIGSMIYNLTRYDSGSLSQGLDRLEMIIEGLLDLVDSRNIDKLNAVSKVLNSLGNSSLASFYTALTENTDSYISSGETIAEKVIEGMANTLKHPDNIQYVLNYIIDMVDASESFVKTEGGDVGLDFSSGYAEGIKDVTSKQKVEAAATEIGNLSIEALRTAIEAHSPAEKPKEAGYDYDDGLGEGIIENAGVPVDAADEVGKKTVDALELGESARAKGAGLIRGFINGVVDTFSELGSAYKNDGVGGALGFIGDKLFNNDTVEGVLDGASEFGEQIAGQITGSISGGILGDNSMLEAAKSKADQIREIFADALSDLSSDISTTDLEYKLWQALNPNASASAASDVEVQVLLNKIQAQTERVNLTNEQYQKAVAELGADDTDTKEMYQTYLQEMTTLADLTTNLRTANQGVIDNINATRAAYERYLADTVEIERMGLFTHEELVRAAQSATGYDPNMTADAMSSRVNEALNTAYNSLQITYQTLATDALATVNADAAQAGVSAAYSAATGMEEGASYVAEAGMDISESALSGLAAGQDGFYEQGVADASSYAAGLSSAEAMSAINAAAGSWNIGGYSGYGGYGSAGGSNTLYYDFIGVMDDWETSREEEQAAEIARINKTIRDAFDKASEDWQKNNPGTGETWSPFYKAFDEFSEAVKNNKYMWLGGEGTLEGSIAEVLGDYARLGHPDWDSDRYRSQSIHRSDWDEENRRYTAEGVIDWQYEYADGLQKVVTGFGGTTHSLDEIQEMAAWATKRGYTLASSFDRASNAAIAFETYMKQQQNRGSSAGGGFSGRTNNITVNQTNYGNGATIKERMKQANDIGHLVDMSETVDEMRARLAKNKYLRPSLR